MDLRFDHLRSTRPRRQKVRAIVLHWTGGIGGAAQVYRTLRARTGPRTPDGLSVHHVIEADGTDVQMCSYDLTCLHAGFANEWSVGIEVVCPGMPGAAAALERKRGINRPLVTEPLRRRKGFSYLDFTPAQYDAVTRRVEQLCDLLGIPRRVLEDDRGELVRTDLNEVELKEFGGVLGHYQCHPAKSDPGPKVLKHLQTLWSPAGA